MTWHATYPRITWTWDSCSGARCRGVLSGKWEVVPVVDSNAISLECSIATECVGHIYRRGTHGSLRGTFMAELLDFTNRACAEARSLTKRGRDSSAESSSSPGRPAPWPISPTHRMPDDDPPARKAARAVTSTTQDESSPVETSAAVSVAQYSAPVKCLFPSGRRRPTLPVSLLLPHFVSATVT